MLESPIQDLADFNASASIVLQTLLQLIPRLLLPLAGEVLRFSDLVGSHSFCECHSRLGKTLKGFALRTRRGLEYPNRVGMAKTESQIMSRPATELQS